MSWQKDQLARRYEGLKQAGLEGARLAPRCEKHGQPLAGIIPGPPVEGLPCPECLRSHLFTHHEVEPTLYPFRRSHSYIGEFRFRYADTTRWQKRLVTTAILSRKFPDTTLHLQAGTAWEKVS